MGVRGFNDDNTSAIEGSRKALQRAAARDRKARRNSKKAQEQVHRSAPKDSAKAVESDLVVETVNVMADFRQRWTSMVIRRTVQSRDWEGNEISGLPPVTEINIMLRLAEYESEVLNEIAGNLGDAIGRSQASATDKVSPAFRICAGRLCVLDAQRAGLTWISPSPRSVGPRPVSPRRTAGTQPRHRGVSRGRTVGTEPPHPAVSRGRTAGTQPEARAVSRGRTTGRRSPARAVSRGRTTGRSSPARLPQSEMPGRVYAL